MVVGNHSQVSYASYQHPAVHQQSHVYPDIYLGNHSNSWAKRGHYTGRRWIVLLYFSWVVHGVSLQAVLGKTAFRESQK